MRLSARIEILIYLVTSILFISGIVWIYAHYVAPSTSQFQDVISPLEPWSLKVHGGAAMAFLMLFGFLFASHIKRAWDAKRNRRSGGSLVAASSLLIVTGYGLYYCGGEGNRLTIRWIHLIIGVALPVFLVVHVIRGKRLR